MLFNKKYGEDLPRDGTGNPWSGDGRIEFTGMRPSRARRRPAPLSTPA